MNIKINNPNNKYIDINNKKEYIFLNIEVC